MSERRESDAVLEKLHEELRNLWRHGQLDPPLALFCSGYSVEIREQFQAEFRLIETLHDEFKQRANAWEDEPQANSDSIESVLDSLCRDHPSRIRATLALYVQIEELVAGDFGTAESQARPFHVGEVVLGRYEIREVLKSGGQGIIYKAWDRELNRVVAVKGPGSSAGRVSLMRLAQEGKMTAVLEHPNILPIYSLGLESGETPCFAVKYIEGHHQSEQDAGPKQRELKDAIKAFHAQRPEGLDFDRSNPAFAKLLDAFRAVCEAMQFAHDQGYLHRDLKPENIMLGTHAEVWIIDWGLAKSIEAANDDSSSNPAGAEQESSEVRISMEGSVKGTLAYMSPEQASGDESCIGPRSDIYGLGATLFEILTGRPPVVAGSHADLMAAFQHKDFGSARSIQPNVPRPLAAICKQALSINPNDRYATPHDLAQQVESWQRDNPVDAYPDPWLEQGRRWIKRHRTLVTGASVAAIVALTASIISSLVFFDLKTRAEVAETAEHQRATELAVANHDLSTSNTRLSQSNYQLQFLRAAKLSSAGEFQLARESLEKCAPSLRSIEWNYLRRLLGRPQALLQVQYGSLLPETFQFRALLASRDGKRVVAWRRVPFSFDTSSPGGSWRNIPAIGREPTTDAADAARSIQSNRQSEELQAQYDFVPLADAPRVVVVENEEGEVAHEVAVIDTETGSLVRVFQLGALPPLRPWEEMSLDATGRRIAFSGHNGNVAPAGIRVFDIDTGNLIYRADNDPDAFVYFQAFGDNDDFFTSSRSHEPMPEGNDASVLHRWSAVTGQALPLEDGRPHPILEVASDRELGVFHIQDTITGERYLTRDTGNRIDSIGATAICQQDLSSLLEMSAGMDLSQVLQTYPAAVYQSGQVHLFPKSKEYPHKATSLTFSAGADQIASAGGGSIQVWDVASNSLRHKTASDVSICCLLDDRTLLANSLNGMLTLNIGDAGAVASLTGQAPHVDQVLSPVVAMLFAPAMRKLVVVEQGSEIGIWDITARQLVEKYQLYTVQPGQDQHDGRNREWLNSISYAAMDSQGKRLAVAHDRGVAIFDLEQVKPIPLADDRLGMVALHNFEELHGPVAFAADELFLAQQTVSDMRTPFGNGNVVVSIDMRDDWRYEQLSTSGGVTSSQTERGRMAINPSGSIIAVQRKVSLDTHPEHGIEVAILPNPSGENVDENELIEALENGPLKLAVPESSLTPLTWSSDSRLLVASVDLGQSSHHVRVYDTSNWSFVDLKGHTAPVTDARLTDDGTRIFTSSEDGTIRLWHIPTETLLWTFDDAQQPIGSIEISPDGSLLFGRLLHGMTGRGEEPPGEVLIWDLSPWKSVSQSTVTRPVKN